MRSQNSAPIFTTTNRSKPPVRPRPELHLHPLSLADQDWITRIVRTENSKSADFNFGNLFLWDQTYCQKVAQFDGRLIIEYRKTTRFILPAPSGMGLWNPPSSHCSPTPIPTAFRFCFAA